MTKLFRNVRNVTLAGALCLLIGVPASATTVNVDGGRVEGTSENGLRVYRGIPFAAPPVGDLRWREPQVTKPWQGIRKALKFGPPCMQASGPPTAGNSPSEDCLYLNIWSPAAKPTDRLPVMVWIHGGGFRAGATSEPIYNGERLAKKGVVFVSTTYRLGPFGFLAHPGLSAEDKGHTSGNYGLLDMIAALQWVQRNIAGFGGDPDRVTIFGESAGGIAVSMLCASPLAKGLFQGAISESGGSFGPASGGSRGPGENMHKLAEAEKAGEAWATSAGASTTRDLRGLPAEKVLSMSQTPGVWWPIVDRRVITDDQYKLYEAGHYNDVPILVGYNSDEGASFTPPATPDLYIENVRKRYGLYSERLLDFYPPGNGRLSKKARDLTRDAAFGWHTLTWARLQAKTGKSKAFVYYFNQHPDYPADSPRFGMGAPHAAELSFVFQRIGQSERVPATPENVAISDAMATYWTNFAKAGDPNGDGLPNWSAFRDLSSQAMYFEKTPHRGPVQNEAGIKTLDAYFAWRRAQAPGVPDTGIAVRRPVFGGACKICPWGAIGQILLRMMEPYDYQVQLCFNCNQAAAPRIVSESRLPPPYKVDAVVPKALAPPNPSELGPVDFGATSQQFLVQAYHGTGAYAGEAKTNLRLIANVESPNYVLVAINNKSGITDLSQLKEIQRPLRIFSGGTGGNIAEAVLGYFGVSRQSIEAAGGHMGNEDADLQNFDVAIGGGGGMTTAPEWRFWPEISNRYDVTFVQLPDELLDKLSRQTGQKIGWIPFALFPQIQHPIRTLVRSGTVIYCRADVPDEFTYDVAKAVDEQQERLQWSNMVFSYNSHNVWKAEDVPLHPGAERYYKEKGYMK